MKLTQFRKLIREEVRRVVSENSTPLQQLDSIAIQDFNPNSSGKYLVMYSEYSRYGAEPMQVSVGSASSVMGFLKDTYGPADGSDAEFLRYVEQLVEEEDEHVQIFKI